MERLYVSQYTLPTPALPGSGSKQLIYLLQGQNIIVVLSQPNSLSSPIHVNTITVKCDCQH